MAPIYTLERTQILPFPSKKVFAFFSEARNLEAITPPFLHFQILTPDPIRMQAGTLIDYQIRLFGLPIRWQTRIEFWDPPRQFVDIQHFGPYRLWHHTHRFTPVDGGTQMTDLVRYQMPFGLLGVLVHALWTQHALKHIFDYRQKRVLQLLQSSSPTTQS